MERNVLGETLELCSSDPLTGWFRDGSCTTSPADLAATHERVLDVVPFGVLEAYAVDVPPDLSGLEG